MDQELKHLKIVKQGEYEEPVPTKERKLRRTLSPFDEIEWQVEEPRYMTTIEKTENTKITNLKRTKIIHASARVEGRTLTASRFNNEKNWNGVEIRRSESEHRTPSNSVEIDTLMLLPRSRNALIRSGFYTIGDVQLALKYDLLPRIRNLGSKLREDIRQKTPPPQTK